MLTVYHIYKLISMFFKEIFMEDKNVNRILNENDDANENNNDNEENI